MGDFLRYLAAGELLHALAEFIQVFIGGRREALGVFGLGGMP